MVLSPISLSGEKRLARKLENHSDNKVWRLLTAVEQMLEQCQQSEKLTLHFQTNLIAVKLRATPEQQCEGKQQSRAELARPADC